MIYQCEFKDAVNLGTEENPDWNWSGLVCEKATTTEMWELIQHPENPEKEFYVQKSFSYGDLLLIFFLTLVLFFAIAGKITSYFWQK